MFNYNDMFKDYEDIENALSPLGFKQTSPGKFTHNLIFQTFDFTACSVEGTMKILFNIAFDQGYSKAQEDIQKAIGLPLVNLNTKLST